MTYKIFAAALIAVTAFSCKKESKEPTFDASQVYPISIEFDNVFGNQNLVLNQAAYNDSYTNDFTVDYLTYYVSNFKLTKEDGTSYTIPQDSSYFLIKEHDISTQKPTVNVPEGDYAFLEFVVGVDSTRNTMDIDHRLGVLDVSDPNNEGMYWGWNSGYVFFKIEGKCSAIPMDSTGNQKYRYHIGGFGGYSSPTINNIKTIKIDLRKNGIAQVRKQTKANIHLMVDIRKVFFGANTIDISTVNNVMFGSVSTTIADNYATMFRHDHTEN